MNQEIINNQLLWQYIFTEVVFHIYKTALASKLTENFMLKKISFGLKHLFKRSKFQLLSYHVRHNSYPSCNVYDMLFL